MADTEEKEPEEPQAEEPKPAAEKKKTTRKRKAAKKSVAEEVRTEADEALSQKGGWPMACHLSTLVTFVTPLANIGGLLAPIVLWQLLKPDDAKVEEHAKEAFNFQANVIFWTLVGTGMLFTCILMPVGVLVIGASFVANVVLTLMAAIKTADGSGFRYPWIYRVLDGPASQTSEA
ncbi:MAG: DUF4870 domain-containing protein [Planctomycetota bacterium]|nr:DUF4870 domain-containing protein [Planctomycetota bacterium]